VVGQQWSQDPGAVGPGQDRDRPEIGGRAEIGRAGRRVRGGGETGGPVAFGRGRIDRGEVPMAHSTGARLFGVGEALDEGTGHADPVLVLRELVIRPRRGEWPVGQEVVLVGGIDEPASERLLVDASATRSRVSTTKAASSVVWARISASWEN
jgi:hypothetical protein